MEDIHVEIAGHETRDEEGFGTYTAYKVVVRPGGASGPSHEVWRRYKDFELLRDQLKTVFPESRYFPFPKKRLFSKDKDVLMERKAMFPRFLSSILANPELRRHVLVMQFLNLPLEPPSSSSEPHSMASSRHASAHSTPRVPVAAGGSVAGSSVPSSTTTTISSVGGVIATASDPVLLRKMARDLVRNQHVGAALEALNRAAVLAPEDPAVSLDLALLLEKDDQLDRAAAVYATACARGNVTAALLHNHAVLLLKHRNKPNEARGYFVRALHLDPDNAATLSCFGAYHHSFADDDEAAERQYVRALAVEPQNARAMYNYASLLESQGDLSRAEQYYRSAMDAAPGDPDLLNGIAQFLETRYAAELSGDSAAAFAQSERRKHVAEIQSLYDRALLQCPTDPIILNNFAAFLEQVKHEYTRSASLYRRAVTSLRSASLKDEQTASILTNCGVFFATRPDSPDISEAQCYFDSAVLTYPHSEAVLSRAADFYEFIALAPERAAPLRRQMDEMWLAKSKLYANGSVTDRPLSLHLKQVEPVSGAGSYAASPVPVSASPLRTDPSVQAVSASLTR